MGVELVLAAILVGFLYLVVRVLRRARLKRRTTTRRFLGMRFGVRGIFGFRSWYIPLPFGYRISLWEKETDAQRRAREKREARGA